MQKQYHRRTTLRTRPWKTQERDAEWSAPTIAHHIHGASVPLGTTVAQRYDVPRDWLWDACHMAGECWGSRCEGFHSKEGLLYHFEQSARNPTINLIHEFGNPLGIPCTWAVLRSLAGLMSHEKVSVRGFLWVRKVWFTFAQQTFAPETFGKRQKGEKSPVVSLLPGSHERLTLRNPRILCQKYGGACTTYYLVVPKVWETGQEIRFPCSWERRKEISE
jgi:hypothetical protein